MSGRHATGLAALAWALALPGSAAAHAFAQRYDLPLPLGFYLAGAGAAVAVSFLGALMLMRVGAAARWQLTIPVPPALARGTGRALRLLALALLALVLAAGLMGPDSPTRNLATVFIWVLWWVGFALFTALVCDLWTPANPFRLVAEALLGVGRLRPRGLPLPATAGWLAVAGLLGIAWLELVSETAETPRAMVAVIGAYAAVTLAGAWATTPAAWFATADPPARLFGMLGRVAPLSAVPGGLVLRLPGTGLGGLRPGASGAVLALCLIAIVLFDGLSETPAWAAVLDWITRSMTLRPLLLWLRDAGLDLMQLIRTLGLLATVLAALVLYGGLAVVMWLAAGRVRPWGEIFVAFAGSLLPIAVGYHLAHYYSYLMLAGQLTISIASDPLGLGWNLFGTAHQRIDLGAATAASTWWVALAALVAGHALSVFVAHAEALRVFPDRRRALASQLPMTLFMVALTALSLWILAQPIVV